MAKSKFDEEGLDGYDWYEGQPKWPLSRILKVVLCSISVFVWILLLLRLFMGSNREFEKNLVLLNARAEEIYPNQISEVLRINSETDDESTSVMIRNTLYLQAVDNLQCTVRVNTRNLPPSSDDLGYTFVLRITKGGETRFVPVSYYAKDGGFGYLFYRLCFDEVGFTDDSVITFLMFPEDFVPLTGEELSYPAGKAKFVFTVYNSDTYCDSVRIPKSDFKTVEEMQ